jgi:hypothetical protein
MILLFILRQVALWWIDIMGGGSLKCIFGAVATMLSFPFPSTRWLLRKSLPFWYITF